METRSKAASRNRDKLESKSTSKNQSNPPSKTIKQMPTVGKCQKKKSVADKKSSLTNIMMTKGYLRIVLRRFDEQLSSKNGVINFVEKTISKQKKMK